MRHGRAKQARKTLQFFQRTIGLHSPYNVLVDGTFLVVMLQSKLPLQERLDRLLQHGSTHQLFMTQSSLHELEMLSLQTKKARTSAQARGDDKTKNDNDDNDENIFQQAAQLAREQCRILIDMPKAPPELEQAKLRVQQNPQNGKPGKRKRRKQETAELELTVAQNDMLRLTTDAVIAPNEDDNKDSEGKQRSNESHKDSNSKEKDPKSKKDARRPVYIVASQDETMLNLLRQFTIPLIRLARGSVLLLEQPSKTIQSQDQYTEEQKWSASAAFSSSASKSSVMTKQEQELVQVMNQEQQKQQREAEKAQQNALLLEAGRRNTKKRKAKAPNPLSCKKKDGNDGNSGKRRRKRKAEPAS